MHRVLLPAIVIDLEQFISYPETQITYLQRLPKSTSTKFIILTGSECHSIVEIVKSHLTWFMHNEK